MFFYEVEISSYITLDSFTFKKISTNFLIFVKKMLVFAVADFKMCCLLFVRQFFSVFSVPQMLPCLLKGLGKAGSNFADT